LTKPYLFCLFLLVSTEHAISIVDDGRENLRRRYGEDDDPVFVSSSSCIGGGGGSGSSKSTQRLFCELEEIRADGEDAVQYFQTQSKELAASFLSSAEGLVERFTLTGHRATARALSLCDKLGRENAALRAQLEAKNEELRQAVAHAAASTGAAWSTPQAKRKKPNLETLGTPEEYAQDVAARRRARLSTSAARTQLAADGKVPFKCFIEDWELLPALARSKGKLPAKEKKELTARFAAKYVGVCLYDEDEESAAEEAGGVRAYHEHRTVTAVEWLPRQGCQVLTVLTQAASGDDTAADGDHDVMCDESLQGYMVTSTLPLLIKAGRNPGRVMVGRSGEHL
jgi:hypothetical protein